MARKEDDQNTTGIRTNVAGVRENTAQRRDLEVCASQGSVCSVCATRAQHGSVQIMNIDLNLNIAAYDLNFKSNRNIQSLLNLILPVRS